MYCEPQYIASASDNLNAKFEKTKLKIAFL